MLDNERHSLAVRIEREFSKNLVLFDLASHFILELHQSLSTFFENQADLLASIDQCKLIRTRSLIENLTCLGIFVNDNCVANSEQSEEMVKLHSISLATITSFEV